VWEKLGLKDCFYGLCWKSFAAHIQVKYPATRFSVNRINNGLTWHHDFVLTGQPDNTLTAPGMTFSIHLGEDDDDVVYIEYKHDKERRTACTPGTAYVFPGGCFAHRTRREYSEKSSTLPKQKYRYSLVVFLNFKRNKAREMDVALHRKFPYYTDNFKYRAEHYQELSKNHGF
jgi:hypothetical protein